MEDSDERTLHRLEAFSDIVIGFSLAQLGAAEVFTKTMAWNASGASAFFASFAIVCSLWYFHHRLFQNYFVPKALPIVLNFLWLAVVVLLVFVSVRSSASGFQSRNATLLYFGLYTLAYFILTLQTAIGMRLKPAREPGAAVKGMRQFAAMAFWSLVFAVNFALVKFMPWTPAIGNAIGMTFGAGVAGSVGMTLYFRKRAVSLPSV